MFFGAIHERFFVQPSAPHPQHSNGSMMVFRHMRSPRDDAGQNALMASLLRSSVLHNGVSEHAI